MIRSREDMLAEVTAPETRFDLAVIGGGANGAGITLDAASRGLKVVLLERGDFACGTSSRSSKLIHGGVRYLALGQWSLVREALAEQALLLATAPSLVTPLRFTLPAYSWLDAFKFRIGLLGYDWLANKPASNASRWLGAETIARELPNLRRSGLRGGVSYEDAHFDDARLIQALLSKARELGAVTLNYADVGELRRGSANQIAGVVAHDGLSNNEILINAAIVINAAGPYGDALRTADDPATRPSMSPSQGAHVVVDASFASAAEALVLPKTADGRIMFAIPWHGRVLLGTTDTPMSEPPRHPEAAEHEIDQILETAATFLNAAPGRSDVRSVFAGLRPLAGATDGAATSKQSREHAITVSPNGLISVSGGKWTTYRLIASQTVDIAIRRANLSAARSTTANLSITPEVDEPNPDLAAWPEACRELRQIIEAEPTLGRRLHPDLPYVGAHFSWAARGEYCRSVSDALCYHARAMFIDSQAALEIAPAVADLMASELGMNDTWKQQQLSAVRLTAARFSVD